MRIPQMPVSILLATLSLAGTALPARAAMVIVNRDSELTVADDCRDASDPSCSTNSYGYLVGHRAASYTGSDGYSNSIRYGTASASETSTISADHIQVSLGAMSGSAGDLNPKAEAFFTLQFSVDAPQKYDLTLGAIGFYGQRSETASLVGPDGTVLGYASEYFNNYFTGVLTPGFYTLMLDAKTAGQGIDAQSSVNADLVLTPVPLPDTLTLTASVLLLGLLVKRRQIKAASVVTTLSAPV